MKSIVELEIQVPQAKLAALYADPEQNTKWLGGRTFVATVLDRELPDALRLNLEARDVKIFVRCRFSKVTPERTRLTHEQEFRFRSPLHKAFGFLARRAIRRAQRRHMESFKRFAEERG